MEDRVEVRVEDIVSPITFVGILLSSVEIPDRQHFSFLFKRFGLEEETSLAGWGGLASRVLKLSQ